MKYLLLITIAVLMTGCATSKTPPTVIETTSTNDLFEEAHRCQGVVNYQAEITSNGEIRSRLSCKWNVTDQYWGAW